MNGYNFTDRVRKVLQMARDEANQLRHHHVDTEHLLLAIIREGQGTATAALHNLLRTADLTALRERVRNAVTPGHIKLPGEDLPYTRAAMKVLQYAMKEARELNYTWVGTEHVLLGLLREGRGIAAKALTSAGVTLEATRAVLVSSLADDVPAESTSVSSRHVVTGYNFTDRVRADLRMAREEAARLRHDTVGTEHILLGLIRDGEGVAAAVLTNLNIDIEEIWQKIEERAIKGKADRAAGPDLPYTEPAKKVLELAMTEARELNHSYIGTEHLLLGLLREKKGIAAEVLTDLGIALEQARAETLRLLGSEMPSGAQGQDRHVDVLARMRALVSELLATPAPDASRLRQLAVELNSLLDELARM